MEKKARLQETLDRAWYDPGRGYGGFQQLWKKVRGPKQEDVRKWYRSQEPVQVFKPHRKPKHFSSIVAGQPAESFQIDLIVWGTNDIYAGYSYIMVVVDVHSRMMDMRAMKNRENSERPGKEPTIRDTFQDIMRGFLGEHGDPKNINADQEFGQGSFKAWCDQHGVKLYLSQTGELNKNAIVERMIRTVKELIGKWKVSTGDPDWVKHLPQFVSNLNHRRQSTIKAVPADVWSGRDNNRQVPRVVFHKFDVGDRVRLLERTPFEPLTKKAGRGIYSEKVYLVKEVGPRGSIVVDADSGEVERTKQGNPKRFKDYQLQKVDGIVLARPKVLFEPTGEEAQEQEERREAVEKANEESPTENVGNPAGPERRIAKRKRKPTQTLAQRNAQTEGKKKKVRMDPAIQALLESGGRVVSDPRTGKVSVELPARLKPGSRK